MPAMQGDAASLLARDRLAGALGVRLAGDGKTVAVEVTVAEPHLNALDGVHGGVLFSLLPQREQLSLRHMG